MCGNHHLIGFPTGACRAYAYQKANPLLLAFKGEFDLAAGLTNDTDLVEPVRIVTQELNLPVTLLTPTAQPATSLMKVATYVRHIQPYIGPCQLPDPVLVPSKRSITKSVGW
jgi:hypothetical protein